MSFFIVGCTSDRANTLYIYSSMDEPTTQALVSAYREHSGSRVEFVRLSTGEAAARIEAERNNPRASLWLGGVGLGHIQIKERGLSESYQPIGAETVPAELRDPEAFWTGLYVGVICIAYNTQQLERRGLEVPKTWEDLTRPEFRNLIQLPNPGTSGTSYNVLTAMIQLKGEEEALDYFHRLHKNVSQYTRSGAAPTNNAAIGETTVALGWAHDVQRLIHDNNVPLAISFPEEGTPYEIASVSLIRGGSQNEMAKDFYNWLYTPEASQILAEFYVIPLVTEGVELRPHSIDPKDIKLIHIDLDWAGKSKDRLVDLWNEKINS